MSTYLAASAGIALVVATLGLADGELGVDSRTRAVRRGLELAVIAETWEPGFATMASINSERAA